MQTTKRLTRTFTASLALLGGAAPAFAGFAAADATLGTLSIKVIDLTPHDGNTAGFSFVEGASGPVGYSSARTFAGRGITSTEDIRSNTDGFKNFDTPSSTYPGSSASVVRSGGATQLQAFANLDGAFAGGALVSYTGYTSSEPWAFTLNVAPHTRLLISQYAATSASASLRCGASGATCDKGYAEVMLSGRLRLPVGGETDTFGSEAGGYAGIGSDAHAGWLNITLSNDTGDTTPAYLITHAVVSVSLVPEPSTYALFGAGLLVVGAARRARRR